MFFFHIELISGVLFLGGFFVYSLVLLSTVNGHSYMLLMNLPGMDPLKCRDDKSYEELK
jgi:hypothetical protein